MRLGMATALLFLCCSSQLSAEDITFTVRLVDTDGKPVEGADLGLYAGVGPPFRALAAKNKTEWHYNRHARSGADGVALITSNEDNIDRLCLVARHEARKIGSVFCVDRKNLDDRSPIQLALKPETQIIGRATCPQLPHDLDGIVVNVRFGGRILLVCIFDDPTFKLSLPPAEYEIEAFSDEADSVRKSIAIKEQSAAQEIEAIELPASKIALLEGHAAPELAEVVAWKNSKPIRLESLRGKCVLLDFWGHWCGPCVHQMPELFKLHDKYADQGLVIIGVHVSVARDPGQHVDTVAKLDEHLASIRKTLWAERDIPFPVALVTRAYRSAPDGTMTKVDNPTVRSYGISGFPTQVLIDRKGNVKKGFTPDAEGIALLEKALAE